MYINSPLFKEVRCSAFFNIKLISAEEPGKRQNLVWCINKCSCYILPSSTLQMKPASGQCICNPGNYCVVALCHGNICHVQICINSTYNGAEII